MHRGFLAVLAVGLVALLAALTTTEKHLAFTLGVTPGAPEVELRPQQGVCQAPIEVPSGASFDQVRVYLGTYMSPSGPPVEVTIHAAGGARVLGRGVVPGGYPDIATAPTLLAKVVPLVRANQQIEVCLKNVGRRRVAVFGAAGEASPSSAHDDRGGQLAGDMTLEFLRPQQRSLLRVLPQLFDRASLFRAPWLGAWAYWALLIGVVGVAPLALWRAMQAGD